MRIVDVAAAALVMIGASHGVAALQLRVSDKRMQVDEHKSWQQQEVDRACVAGEQVLQDLADKVEVGELTQQQADAFKYAEFEEIQSSDSDGGCSLRLRDDSELARAYYRAALVKELRFYVVRTTKKTGST